jgi:hypothetical protein
VVNRRDPEGHRLVQRFEAPWSWFTYLYNAIAARAFLALDLDSRRRPCMLRRDDES